MKSTWHRVNTTVFGESHDPGTWSMFFDYNLARWTLGIFVQPDHLWLTTYVNIGPFEFDLTYWRIEPTDTGSVT